MAIPDYQTIMLPLLKLVKKHGDITLSKAITIIADQFNLTELERRQVLSSGKQAVISSRVSWANTYLKKAGLLFSPQRGILSLTEQGKIVLSQDLEAINVEYLEQFPDFAAFKNAARQKSKPHIENKNLETPEEILEEAYFQIKEQALSDVLDKIKSCSPLFFENLVVDTIVKMGYGGSHKDAGQAIGRSGDEGIDGIINEDRLGLDVIYIQAKRWTGNVSRPEIQKFAGALQGKRAKKGIFITTSDFTSEAREYAKNIDAKIILISGQQLVELMWEYGIGLSSAGTYELKKLDLDYFSEPNL
jgi:restriction system protein